MKHPPLNIPTSIVISGVESERYFDIVVRQCGRRFVLMSYHYLQKKPKDFLKQRKEEFPDLLMFIDSGAHTFLANYDKFKDKPMSFWEDYLKTYTQWALDNKDYIFAIADLDIDWIVGEDVVDKWRKEYFEPLEEQGVQVCYIWHGNRGIDGWKDMCRKYSYVGLSYEKETNMTPQRLTKMILEAKKTNTRVHGMALTQTELLVKIPLFTSDSSVDGKSKVLVRFRNTTKNGTKNPTAPYRIELMSIEELYNLKRDMEFRTTEYETKVPFENVETLTVDNDNKVVWGELYGVTKHTVRKPTVKLVVEGGKEIICTTDHSIITMDKQGNLIETKADALKVGDYVLSPYSNTLTQIKEGSYKDNKLDEYLQPHESVGEAERHGIPKELAIEDFFMTDEKHPVKVSAHRGRINRKYSHIFSPKVAESELLFLEIKDIQVVNDGTKEVEVYDLSVRDYERFFANGILVHNTTWLVGQQYGELNWFNGRKMQRLSKQEWQRNYKTKLLKEPFNADWDLLMTGMGGKGDTYELLRLNVIAYDLAEQHIRKRLRSKMYWMEGKSMNTKLDIKLPPYEWYHSEENEGWEEYLRQFNISPQDYTKDEAVDILYYFFLFLVDKDNHIDELDDELLIEYAQKVSEDDSIEDRESAIEFLREFYRANATGERTDFIGENSMEVVKERPSYITEDEFTVVDLTAKDIEANFGLALPSPREDSSMPEIEELDKELMRNDIIPVRDEKGRFLKGQKKVRKPKNLYSDKYPVLNCNTCYKAGECPEYKAGYVCAYKNMFKRFNTRDMEDIMDAMTSMVNANLERLQRAMIFETLDGGMITQEVTTLIDQNMKLLSQLKDLQQSKAVVSQKRVIREDGTEETITQVNVNPQQGGILSKLFGMDEKPSKEPEKTGQEVSADYEVKEG